MFVATLSEHLVCNRLFFTLVQPIGIFICGSVLFIFIHSNTLTTIDDMDFFSGIGALRRCVGKCLSHRSKCRFIALCAVFRMLRCVLVSFVMCECVSVFVCIGYRMQRVRAYECISLLFFLLVHCLCTCACVCTNNWHCFWHSVNVVVFFLI